MGYFINKAVASVNNLTKVTLAHNSHFIKFSSTRETKGELNSWILTVNKPELEDIGKPIILKMVEKGSGIKHEIKGTYSKSEANSTSFFIVTEGVEINESKEKATEKTAKELTAQNIQACLVQNSYFRNNFEISTGFVTNHHGSISSDNILYVKAKGLGLKYNFDLTIVKENIVGESLLSVQETKGVISSYDTIDYNTGEYNVELEIYTDTGLFLGEDDSLSTNNRGKYITSLTKSYHQNHIWFDLNTLLGRKATYADNFIEAKSWCDAGTMQNFRIIGKRSNGINLDTFYSSEVLYVVNGYDYTLNKNNLEDYIFDVLNYNGKEVKPLSNHPRLNHITGQKHYFNFILKDDAHKLDLDKFKITRYDIGLLYKFHTQLGDYIGQIVKNEQTQQLFDNINTIEIGLDTLIKTIEQSSQKTVGKVEVMLSRDKYPVSTPLLFNVLPENSYVVKDFAFLNRLGGWDAFNFGNSESVEFKTTSETYHKTLSPDYKTYSQLESVSRKNVSEQMTVRTLPITRQTAEWLRELSASPAVYELATKRYVIVDEFTLKYDSKSDLFQIDMKYRYSDSYNSGLSSK